MPKPGEIYTDGYSSTDQGLHGKAKSKGSRKVSGRDPSEAVNYWWTKVPLITDIPTLPMDENGNPYRLCGRCGTYVKRAGFAKDAQRKDGLDSVCRECRHLQYVERKGK